MLFVHQNFPAQFIGVASALASRADHEIVAIGSDTAHEMPNIRLLRYGFRAEGIGSVHPFARRFECEVRRAEQILYVASDLVAGGFDPDIIFAHCGWGESLPLRTVFPHAKIVTYFEYFYRSVGLDTNFDPEWPKLSRDSEVGLSIKNAATLLVLADTDLGISPTEWQRATFPPGMQHLISVCHEGVETRVVRPDARAVLTLPDGRILRAGEEIVTFVSRDLEPLRGYHVFMRSLARVLRERPKAHVVIVGGDRVSYGLAPPPGLSWKQIYLDRHDPGAARDRVHFLGHVDYATYLKVLQVSTAHVYLTYPFVLSWSLMEAMAAGCLIVASRTGPVTEVVNDSNGVLVDFFDHAGLSERVVSALAEPQRHVERRARAREAIVSKYDRRDCLQRLFELVEGRVTTRSAD